MERNRRKSISMEQSWDLHIKIFLSLCFPLLCTSLNSDGLSLLALKSAITSDPTGVLSTWSDSDPTPCKWPGVLCSSAGVISLSLSARGLSGYLPSEIGALASLKILSLSRNNFSMPIPAQLFNATSLVFLDLSHNSFSGAIPPQIAALSGLSFLDLSSNLLNGSLPVDLTGLTLLRGTLNLSYNQFSGPIPPSYGRLPVLLSLDLQYNNLTGEIPQVGSLLNQGPTAFAGNPNLCGFPLNNLCPEQGENPSYVPLNPKDDYEGTPNPGKVNLEKSKTNRMPLIVLLALVVVVAVFLSMWLASRKWLYADAGVTGKKKANQQKEADYDEAGQNSKFVEIEEGLGFAMEDLLRASAYVVGKSWSGIVYKVVVGTGRGVVAVTRLSEREDFRWRLKDFESEAEAIGRVRHPNIVRLRAYYYATDERLLVSDFISNGSLYTALHGGGADSSDTPPLSWVSRLKIAQGAARGLTHIHECIPKKYIHGNLKSSKILLDEKLQPYISGFGLHRLTRSSTNHTRSIKRHHSSNISFESKKAEVPSYSAYLAPEAQAGSKVTQKCDVYAFGIVLMEILTGRLPDNDGKKLEGLVRTVFQEERPLSEIIDPALLHQVHVKKQVLSMFHVALSCTELEPDQRPRMKAVCASLEAINKLQ